MSNGQLHIDLENTLAELALKINSTLPSESCKDISYCREGMVSKKFESDFDITFKFLHKLRREDIASCSKHNCSGFIVLTRADKTFMFTSAFILPRFIEDVPGDAIAKVYDKITLVKTSATGIVGDGAKIDIDVMQWIPFLRILTSQWDLSYAGRSLKYVDYPADQEVDRVRDI